jgi:hypothetical protein
MANPKKKMVQKIVNWPFEPGSERRVYKTYENTPNYEKFINNINNIYKQIMEAKF